MKRILLLLLMYAVAVAVAACAGTLDDPERFTSALGAAPAAADAAPACPDVPALLADRCATAGCHSAAAKAANVDLGSPNVAARLVDVPSMTTGKLVDPTQPSASVLFQRIQPTAAGRMPVTGDPLDDGTIACVLAWIGGLATNAGAPSSPTSSSTSPEPSAAPSSNDAGAPAPRPTIRVAAGAAAAYTDKSGAVWSADTGFSGGKTMVESTAVSGTDDGTLYDGQRWGQDPNSGAGIPFSYAFDLPDGDYQVTLKFAELFTGITAAGQRVFDVSIEGKAVLTSFDIFATAGGRNIAVDKSFPVTVTGGKLTIDFQNGSANFAKVDAILVAPK